MTADPGPISRTRALRAAMANPALPVLAAGQLLGWGATFYVVPVLGAAISAELGMSPVIGHAGIGAMLLGMALASPLAGEAILRVGARRIIAAGFASTALALALLALAAGPVTWLAAWALTGVACAFTLATPAQALLAEIDGAKARQSISALLLVTGLSGSIFQPILAALAPEIGWRGLLLGSAVLCLAAAPLHLVLLPRVAPAGRQGAPVGPVRLDRNFVLVAAGGALSGLLSWGLAVVMIDMLRAQGFPPVWAVGLASGLGVTQVLARLADFLAGPRWDALATARLAMLLMPAGLLTLLAAPSPLAGLAFVLAYGLASGAMTVARATLPLTFWDASAYARASGRIALPIQLAFAAGGPVFGALLTAGGPEAVLAAGTALALAGLACYLALRRP